MVKSLRECVDLSLKTNETTEHLANILVNINEDTWQAYAVTISHREFTLLCNCGTATYVVDTYGDRHTFELFDYERDIK